MAFNAGSIVGKLKLDSSDWDSGLKKTVKGVGTAALAIGGTFVAAMTKATLASNEWQKKLTNVNTLIDTTEINSQDMAKSLLGLNSNLGKTTELTDAMYQSFSSGADDMEEALSITTDSAKFAKAALTDTSTAVDVLTTAQNAYGKSVMDTGTAGDLFLTTIKEGKINGEELSGVIGQSIPLFASAGIGLDEVSTGIAAMTKQGIAASETTTQMNAIVTQFLKPSSELASALEDVGYQSGAAFLEAEGLSGALGLLEEESGGSADELYKLLPNVRALRGAMALTGEGGKEFNNILTEMQNSTGAVDEAFNKQEMTFETFQASLEKVELVAGNVGKYFVDDIAGGATQAAEGMLDFIMSASMGEVVGNIVGTVASGFELLGLMIDPIVANSGPALELILGQVGESIELVFGDLGEASGGFNLFATTSQFAASGLNVLAVIIQGTIENIANLIVAIKASGSTIGSFFSFLKGKKKWQEVKTQATAASEAFKSFGTGAAENASEAFAAIGSEVKNFGEAVEQQALEMEAKVTTSFANQKQSILTNWDEIITGQKDLTEGMLTQTVESNAAIVTDTQTTTKTLSSMWDSFLSDWEFSFQGAFDNVLSAGNALLSGLSTIASMESENATSAIEAEYASQEKALEEKLAAGLISQEEYEAALELMEAEKSEKLNAAAKEAFESNKLFEKANVVMSAASSIAGWWASATTLGPIAGPIFAGVMTAATLGMAATQISLIDSQTFVPSYEQGGYASGLSLMNEGGNAEMVNLPDGSIVVPHDMSQQIANEAGKSNVIYVSFEGANFGANNPEEIAEIVSRKLARKMKGIA